MSNKNDRLWIFKIVIIAFIISIIFSLISEIEIPKVNLIFGILLTLLFIFLGIIFDMIGVSVTSSDESVFNSMSAQKVKGAKTAVILKKNADKVSSICNDVIGDICGIVSGSSGAVISLKIIELTKLNSILVTVLIMGLISALNIGGKAFVKKYAIKNSEMLFYRFSKIVSIFIKKR